MPTTDVLLSLVRVSLLLSPSPFARGHPPRRRLVLVAFSRPPSHSPRGPRHDTMMLVSTRSFPQPTSRFPFPASDESVPVCTRFLPCCPATADRRCDFNPSRILPLAPQTRPDRTGDTTRRPACFSLFLHVHAYLPISPCIHTHGHASPPYRWQTETWTQVCKRDGPPRCPGRPDARFFLFPNPFLNPVPRTGV